MYLLLKTLHVLSVVMFLGNIVTGLFWKAHADATGDPRLQAHTLRGVTRSDAWFTMPSVVAIIATGVALALEAGLPLLGTQWILLSLIAFGGSGLLFGLFIAPLQRSAAWRTRRRPRPTAPTGLRRPIAGCRGGGR
jgi:uncharacterized membrane protein